MRSKSLAAVILFAGAAISFQACNSSKTVTRVEESSVIDLTGKWNDTDSRLVSKEMVSDMLSRPWLTEFTEGMGKRPVVIVGLIENKSHEHIASGTFINDIEREVLNSGKVRLVQAGAARDDLRRERADQNEYSSAATAKSWGKELGADFILQGEINSFEESDGRNKLTSYQTNLTLVNLETNEKVWIGDKKIKKVIK